MHVHSSPPNFPFHCHFSSHNTHGELLAVVHKYGHNDTFTVKLFNAVLVG